MKLNRQDVRRGGWENAPLSNCFNAQFTRAVHALILDANRLVATTVLFTDEICSRLIWLQPNATRSFVVTFVYREILLPFPQNQCIHSRTVGARPVKRPAIQSDRWSHKLKSFLDAP